MHICEKTFCSDEAHVLQNGRLTPPPPPPHPVGHTPGRPSRSRPLWPATCPRCPAGWAVLGRVVPPPASSLVLSPWFLLALRAQKQGARPAVLRPRFR